MSNSAPATPSGTKTVDTARRDVELRRLFVDLTTDRQRALERIWQLCADDLYGLTVWRTGSRPTAEDAVQEVFVRLARCAPDLTEVRRPFDYLLTMAHRAAIDAFRGRRPTEDLETAALVVSETDPERAAEAAKLSQVLGKLNPIQREVIYLKHFMGLTFRAIGTVTEVSTFTAASRYRLAIRHLRRLMEVRR